MNPPADAESGRGNTAAAGLRLVVSTAVVTLLALLTTFWLFRRMQRGELFLFRLPFDAPATVLERADAIHRAAVWLVPAMLTVCVLPGLAVWLWQRRPRETVPLCPRWVVMLLVMATLADVLTTWNFFQAGMMQEEVHPGVRLLGYALGRTAGPVFGKGIQLAGICFVGRVVPKFRTLLFLGSSILMFAAAAHNMLN